MKPTQIGHLNENFVRLPYDEFKNDLPYNGYYALFDEGTGECLELYGYHGLPMINKKIHKIENPEKFFV